MVLTWRFGFHKVSPAQVKIGFGHPRRRQILLPNLKDLSIRTRLDLEHVSVMSLLPSILLFSSSIVLTFSPSGSSLLRIRKTALDYWPASAAIARHHEDSLIYRGFGAVVVTIAIPDREFLRQLEAIATKPVLSGNSMNIENDIVPMR